MNIKEELLTFISTKESNGALLLSGKWGCGKSYLIKSIAKELNADQEYAVAIISLFGISTTSELDRKVKQSYLELSSSLLGTVESETGKRAKSFLKRGTDVFAALFPAVAPVVNSVSSIAAFDILSFVNVTNMLGKGAKEKTFILIFDDLERSEIPQKQLLGVINNYTENLNIKTIIVANEDEIKDADYPNFKEKLIFRTLQQTSDYVGIIKSLIDSYLGSAPQPLTAWNTSNLG